MASGGIGRSSNEVREVVDALVERTHDAGACEVGGRPRTLKNVGGPETIEILSTQREPKG